MRNSCRIFEIALQPQSIDTASKISLFAWKTFWGISLRWLLRDVLSVLPCISSKQRHAWRWRWGEQLQKNLLYHPAFYVMRASIWSCRNLLPWKRRFLPKQNYSTVTNPTCQSWNHFAQCCCYQKKSLCSVFKTTDNYIFIYLFHNLFNWSIFYFVINNKVIQNLLWR